MKVKTQRMRRLQSAYVGGLLQSLWNEGHHYAAMSYLRWTLRRCQDGSGTTVEQAFAEFDEIKRLARNQMAVCENRLAILRRYQDKWFPEGI